MKSGMIGEAELINTKIDYGPGKNNIIYCDNTYGKVILRDSKILFCGSNSLIYIWGNGKQSTICTIVLYDNSTVHIGKKVSFHKDKSFKILGGEETSVFIGDDCLLSLGITVRPHDGHLIYSCDTHERINKGASIFIGDHVWLGQEVLIAKGSVIGSGTVIGAKSFLSGKTYESNCIYAGIPAKLLKRDIFFDKEAAKTLKNDDPRLSTQPSDEWIYAQRGSQLPQVILDYLDREKSMEKRIDFLKHIPTSKNRFAI